MQDLMRNLLLGGGGGFSPQSLFTGGVVGAFYDPSDLSALYQDSAGTTPVTGVEQVVGLMLDKSQGLVLGSELVTNGDFSSGGTDWSLGSGWSIVGGQAVNGGGGTGQLRQLFPSMSVGWYVVEFDATVSASQVNVILETTSIAGITSSGHYKYIIYIASTSFPRIYFGPNGGFVGSIDNVSVRELPGNHATSTGSARPTLSARVNLLTYSEEFDNGAWTKTNATVTANTIVAPDGTLTGDKLITTAVSGSHYESQAVASISANTNYSVSVYLKAAEYGWAIVYVGSVGAGKYVNLSTGALGANFIGAPSASAVSDAGNGWWRVTLTFASGANTSCDVRVYATTADNTSSYTGDGTSGIYIWGADLRPTNIGVNIPSYQRIAAATNYDTNGFPFYLSFGGAQSMSTPASIPFDTVTSDGQARRNLLSNPTQFDVSTVWDTSSGSVTVTANTTTSPDGSVTADTLTENTANSVHAVFQLSALGAAGLNTFSVYAKASTRSWVVLRVDGASTFFDVGTGAVGTVGSGCTASITNVGNGWYRCVVSKTWAANNNCWIRLATGNGVESYTGDGTSGIYIWGAQLETGSTATAFQNIGTDKVTVYAGVRKLSDAAFAVVSELSAVATSNNGAFLVAAPNAAGPRFAFYSRGTLGVVAEINNAAYAAPISNVFTGLADISGDSALLRLNGVQVGSNTGDQGTGNFGTYPLFIGARNNASSFLTGYLYSLIIQGAAASATQLASTEAWVNQKTKAY